MLKIRLQRVGRAHEPSFRLVLTESANSTKSGRFKEVLGNYDPRKTIEALKSDRIKYWISKGASTTGTVQNLLIKKGVIRGKKIHVGMDAKPQAVVEKAPEPVAEAEAPIEEAKSDTIEATEPPSEAPAETTEEAA